MIGYLIQVVFKDSKSAYTTNGTGIVFLKFLNLMNLFALLGNVVFCGSILLQLLYDHLIFLWYRNVENIFYNNLLFYVTYFD